VITRCSAAVDPTPTAGHSTLPAMAAPAVGVPAAAAVGTPDGAGTAWHRHPEPVAVLLVTLIGAVLGGLLGTRYHREVDRVGFDS